jgi:hypothetical protein
MYNSFGSDLCSIFDLDSKNVRSIQIDLQPDSPVMVKVELYLHREQADKVTTVVKKYKLIEIPDETN